MTTEKKHRWTKTIFTRWVPIVVILLAVIGGSILFSNHQTRNKDYKEAIDNGIKAVATEKYTKASIYFDQALEIKNEDPKAEKLLDRVSTLRHVERLYLENQFNDASEEIRKFIEVNQADEDLAVFIENAENLKGQIASIFQKQAQFEEDYQSAIANFSNFEGNNEQLNDIILVLENLLADEEINQVYNQKIKEEVIVFYEGILQYQEQQKHLVEIEERFQNELQYYSDEEIKYAQSILAVGYPNSSEVTVTKRSDAMPIFKTIDIPGPLVILGGSSMADGSLVYAPMDNNQIKHYPVDFSSRTGLVESEKQRKENAENVLNDAEVHDLNSIDTEAVLEKLRTTQFLYE